MDGPADDPDPTPRRGPVTLRTIAELAGVHVTTVSRVLAPPAQAVRTSSPETAQRIREIAAELGYRPDPHGRALRTNRSHLVGVLVPRLADLVLATIYEGVEDAAGRAGYSTFVTNSQDDVARRADRTDMLLARRVDGILLGDAPVDGSSLGLLVERGVPYALVSRRAPGHPSVTCDDLAGGRLAAEHLLALGHRDVAVVAGEPYTSTGLDRTGGFLAAFAEAGHPVPDHRVRRSGFDVRGGREAAEALLATGPLPTAVFAVNDFAAIGVMGAVRDRGLTPGREVSVVGFNDVPLAAELPVGLTTVRSPMHEMGRRGFALLLARIEGRTWGSELLDPELVARASTGPAPR
ncbi:LacI family DNA-binding transcriptional regulator [Quadrisphaera sp. INWT6]|uniref:LacI family DNA-binding transcriptional regulator n=1 Tax=Quadrisphaera sp. INWT6 TaxID=2596917 RepID=UPI00189270EC|nr:LacI family DNA-binding transcriptional regulator [Quadrisphaera sp. INWT6]MBF5083508.1 LacI family DNA-binding transcriptional regulator [Quadrisphaera sp. INWT6]